MTMEFDEDTARFRHMLSVAMEVFATTQEVLQGTVNRLKAEGKGSAKDVSRDVRDMNAALLQVLSLEEKAREKSEQRQDGGGGVLDLDGARAEIGLRLACLRAARDGGEISGGAGG